MMTRESGTVMASEEARRERFNEDERQLLGTIQPGGDDELPEVEEYTHILHLTRKWQ